VPVDGLFYLKEAHMDKGIPNGNGSFDFSILQDHEVNENALRVYIVLSSAQWLTRKTGMKREDIAELAGISIQQTSHGISCLVKNGWIVQRRIPNKPSRYLIKAGFFAEDDPAAPGFDLGDCEIEKNGCTDSDTSKKTDISKGVQPNQPVSDTAERISDESGVRGEGQGTLLVLSSPSLFPEEVSKSKKESLAEKRPTRARSPTA
jgi:hypothetical protein